MVMERIVTSTATMPVLARGENRLAAIHRRAGIAAILRDERLEIEIGESGAVRARCVSGARRGA
jgi:hypothetical protein